MIRTTLVSLALLATATAPLCGRSWYVAVGDSITEGTGDIPFSGGYPSRLQSLLQAQGIDAQVDNRGVGGETTIGAMNRIDAIVENGGDVLLLMEGTNDISRHVSLETIIFNLNEMARRAEAGGFGVVHSTLIPRLPSARVDPHNNINELLGGMIRELAIEHGRLYADPFRDLIALPMLFTNYYWDDESDPVGHPNADGYDELAESFLASATSPCFQGSSIIASFSSSGSGGNAPYEVAFTDTSPAEAISWAWDFDDDGIVDSVEQNPTVTYLEEGTYSVRLRISDGQCSATRLHEDVVTVLPAPLLPSNLTATPYSASAIDLAWVDNADDETHLVVEGRTGTGEFETLALLSPDTTRYRVGGLEQRSYHAFRVQYGLAGGVSDYSNEASATTLGIPAACAYSDEELCLANGRMAATVLWRDHDDRRGIGHASQLSEDSGFFWFFNDANLELVVKALDGSGINSHFWTFYGSLTEVEFVLTLMDTETGLTRSYVNSLGDFASVGDTESFPSDFLAAPSSAPREQSTSPSTSPLASPLASMDASCSADPGVLCLREGRFELSVEWTDFEGGTGVGTAVPATSDTGFFWFFREQNIELAIKVLDGRTLNGHFWVFFGALSNVEYTVTVVDTVTGNQKVYFNPIGTFASFGDTAAFEVDPD